MASSKRKRATIAMQYRIRLIGPDGAEWEWRITDSYFFRRLAKIGKEMLKIIRKHDLSYEFGLTDHEPKFWQCKWCEATSVGDKRRHKIGCPRPNKGEGNDMRTS